ncbi:type II toxin-antitoxin system VapB family antitoxin [Nocardia bovistercoris]|uniref:Ribbon-helix-helix protein, CopG family n=1 Tax=Nocardia bovistercoris TaxID=2785916 RepID=A0A931N2E7_9NOCA|nr:ribbon-helix-helix protein, CopG family [Nocardia bovistercoris]MBH0775956.1 ribbon-helix-helix protein, CopG family [Nocardia bovistercoris]
MTNVLIRGLSDAAVERIDAEADALGLSRNEFLRRKLEREAGVSSDVTLTADDWGRSAAAFVDLADPSVMDDAWR